MRVLVAYATHHGATRGIAERIATTLTRLGVDATARPADESREVGGYDAFVVGSAIYAFRWLGEAHNFVNRNRETLAARPTWFFSSGPVGTATVDAEGRDVRQAPREIASLSDLVDAREHRIFFGAYDPGQKPIGLMERITRALPATRDLLPAGDFRDWDEIDAFATSIADELARVPAVPAGRP
jgi:menaquinone-dependent protoporphyrinogen oxidase